jgi:Lrp/AsnC family transcriptional regulator for asnA, asnC and gidA
MSSITLELDDLDREIISMLQENARRPFAEIAKELKVSEGTIHNRVKRLLREGVIKGFQAVVDPEKVGKALTAIVCVNVDPPRGKEVINRITNVEDVYEVYDVTGEYYAVLKIRTKNRDSLTRIIDKISSIDGVTSTLTMIVLKINKERSSISVS